MKTKQLDRLDVQVTYAMLCHQQEQEKCLWQAGQPHFHTDLN
jgi:hypothetical protein